MRPSSLSDGMRPTAWDRAERPERGSHLGRRQLWLVTGSEVAALVVLVEGGEFVQRLLSLDLRSSRLRINAVT
jgi:hypothetical protein